MRSQTPSRLLVIAGATASGKTAAAVHLATRLNAEIIGADSVQLYRRLDIGSAKPTAEELHGVSHHLLDVAAIDEPFDAARYVSLADEAIRNVHARGRHALVVGGTGLYLRALLRGLAEGIPSDPSVRAALNERAHRGPEELSRMYDELLLVDPVYAAKIHRSDPIRIVRALEVYTLSGVPISVHHQHHAALPPRYEALFVAIESDRAVLRQRIAARTHVMLQRGWIDEVRAILADGFDPELKPLRSVGYAEVVAHVRGEIDASVLEERITTATTAFAKRQRTWFRGEQGVEWLPAETLVTDEFLRRIKTFLDSTPTLVSAH